MNLLMRHGDRGRMVIMAVPSTAHAMSRYSSTSQTPVDVKSPGAAIHFTADRRAGAKVSDIVPSKAGQTPTGPP